MEVWFGEWALAVDNCAHWLQGFNDAGSKPQFGCRQVECPKSYLPAPFNVDFDRTADTHGPYGYNVNPDIQQHIYDTRVIKNG